MSLNNHAESSSDAGAQYSEKSFEVAGNSPTRLHPEDGTKQPEYVVIKRKNSGTALRAGAVKLEIRGGGRKVRSASKKKRLERIDKLQSREDEETMKVRYVLFYADDMVTHGIQSRVRAHYQRKLDDDNNVVIDHKAENKFLEQGFYFNTLLVSPRSPKKRSPAAAVNDGKRSPGAAVASAVPPRQEESALVSRRPTFGKGKLELNLSPTFRIPDGSSGGSAERRSAERQGAGSQGWSPLGIQEMDAMLLSPATPPAANEEGPDGPLGGQTCNKVTVDHEAILPDEEDQWLESLMHMQGLSSFLDSHYTSPNLREITRIVRVRAIEQIDDKLKEWRT